METWQKGQYERLYMKKNIPYFLEGSLDDMGY